MDARKTRWLLLYFLCVVFASQASAQDTLWETYMATAEMAYRQGDYDDAEDSVKASFNCVLLGISTWVRPAFFPILQASVVPQESFHILLAIF